MSLVTANINREFLDITVKDKDGNEFKLYNDGYPLSADGLTINNEAYAGVECFVYLNNQHFSDEYNFSTDNGIIIWDPVSGTAYFTPSSVGPANIYVNGVLSATISVILVAPDKPSIVSPVNLSDGVITITDIIGSPYAMADGSPQVKAHWQIAKDAHFQNLVVDVETTEYLTQYPMNTLEKGVNYYVRVRYSN